MKLRQQPEDFRVEEIPIFVPDPKGAYFVYQMTKRSLSTLEALDILRRRIRLSRKDVSASGLKDKHALTTQLVSFKGPIPGDFEDDRISLRFVGKSAKALNPSNIEGNRFCICARRLSDEECEVFARNADQIRQQGIPNFYDSQRFGGGAKTHEFPGRAMLLGQFEEALRLHLAVPRRKQSQFDKRIRKLSAKHWGDWDRLVKKLPKSSERSIVAYLCGNPENFAGALERIDPKLTGLYLAAYQSWLFNLILNRVIASIVPAESLRPIAAKGMTLMFWRKLDDSQRERLQEMKVPLLNHRSDLGAFDPIVAQAVGESLKEEGLELSDLVVRGMDSVKLYGSERSALIEPANLELDEAAEDELNPGHKKITARFELPRGSFATLVMKRLGVKDQE